MMTASRMTTSERGGGACPSLALRRRLPCGGACPSLALRLLACPSLAPLAAASSKSSKSSEEREEYNDDAADDDF
jgi:hypothetical protein